MLEKIIGIISWIPLHFTEIIAAAVGLLGGLIGLFLLIPGPHPEDWFQKAKEFLEKFSRK